jgi:hypothetical protein
VCCVVIIKPFQGAALVIDITEETREGKGAEAPARLAQRHEPLPAIPADIAVSDIRLREYRREPPRTIANHQKPVFRETELFQSRQQIGFGLVALAIFDIHFCVPRWGVAPSFDETNIDQTA